MATSDLVGFVLLVLASFLPPLFFAVSLRNAERHRREPWQGLAKMFLWGAFGAAFLAALVEAAIFAFLPGAGETSPILTEREAQIGLGLLAVAFVAPVVEETIKALGMRWVRDEDPEPEDGAIHGGMIGLGFAGTETAFYISIAYGLGGLEAAAATALLRGVATVSLHGAASAIAGHGYYRQALGRRPGAFLGALLVAMLFHGAYNLLASIDALWALGGAMVLALWTWVWIRRRVRRLDAYGTAA